MQRLPRPRHGLERWLPHNGWGPQRLTRLLLAMLTSVCVLLASWARIIPPRLNLRPGQTATRTIRAPRGGVYVDEEEMARLREDAAASVSDVYEVDRGATDDALGTARDLFDSFRMARRDPTLTTPGAKMDALRNSLDIRLSPETLELAVTASDSRLMHVEDDVSALVRAQEATEVRSNTDDLARARVALKDAARSLGLSSLSTDAAVEIGQSVLKPNRIANGEKTEQARQEKRDAVKDITHQIQPGEIIIPAGTPVRPGHIAAFQAVGLMQPTVDYYQAAGVLILCTVLVMMLLLFGRYYVRRCYESRQQLMLLCGLLVAAAFAYQSLEPSQWFEPGAITCAITIAMIVALLLDVFLAMAAGVVLGLLLPIIGSGSDARLVIVTSLCAIIGVFMVARHGSHTRVISHAAPLMALLAPGLLLVADEVFGSVVQLRALGAAALGGLAAPLLAMGASVALERLVGVTTDLRLMELGNPNEPVLRRLLAEAPGTYQSSVMVGNLAEPAAEAIGANALLVRTAAMYHDIGKLRRPYFFVENQRGLENPHDRLSPHLSALVIIAHVKDGVELAEEYGLPEVIKDAVQEHHGTGLVKYFYQRALGLAGDPEGVHEGSFRYPGPKPQSRETALLMLADTIEAAARTLETHSPQEIQDLVHRLIDERLKDGQLDESPLSFHDLATVRRVFIHTLTSMFHQRIKYPDQLVKEVTPSVRGASAQGPQARPPQPAPPRPQPPPAVEDEPHAD